MLARSPSGHTTAPVARRPLLVITVPESNQTKNMSTEQSKSSSSASSSPQQHEAPQPPPPAVAHYPPVPYNYPPPPGAYPPPPFYAYTAPDPSHHDPNAPNSGQQPVAPFFMAVQPPPGMFYLVPPSAPGASCILPSYHVGAHVVAFGSGYPYSAGIPPPQPPPKQKRKQVKMAVSQHTFVMHTPFSAPCVRCLPGVSRVASFACKDRPV